jgi:glucose-1-phosphate cytidylyltransferase
MMKTVILAGGLGTRISEMTSQIPKPMIEIGGKPILWHIMSIYASHGFKDFVVALGYKGELIKEFFLNYRAINSDLNIDLSTGKTEVSTSPLMDWRLNLIDTGLHTQTGGRIKAVRDAIGNETFLLTYGDGVADIDIPELIAFHKSHGRLATVTAVHPPARFGGLVLDGNQVVEFSEKNQAQEGWINGGFFVLEPEVFQYIRSAETMWEKEPLEALAAEGQLMAYPHDGFWQPMDTLREQRLLQSLWDTGNAPWSVNHRVILQG